MNIKLTCLTSCTHLDDDDDSDDIDLLQELEDEEAEDEEGNFDLLLYSSRSWFQFRKILIKYYCTNHLTDSDEDDDDEDMEEDDDDDDEGNVSFQISKTKLANFSLY